ncbi:MAG: fructosamine kinase family protein [Actinomycetia bacterium]|nr:fructosamine kinase family protein [Actinomycetes bacterium]
MHGVIEQHLAAAGIATLAAQPVTGGDICSAWRIDTPTGPLFAKAAKHTPAGPDRTVAAEPTPADPGMFVLEAAGLDWLAQAGAHTPEVVAANQDILVLQWLDHTRATPAAAHRLGADLGRLHSTPAAHFGCPPGSLQAASGWLGALQLPFGSWDSWPQFYVEGRLRPTAELARAAGSLPTTGQEQLTRLYERILTGDTDLLGPDISPRRCHGDLWSGNVLWSVNGAALIDPAATGGHPETDLAMLQLFGIPHFAEIVRGYQTQRPLALGWQQRTAMHQLLPLLVHCALFGSGYWSQTQATLQRLTTG